MGFSSVHAALSLGLNFSHGINFAKDVKDKFGCSIHPSIRSGHFTLVVSFGRANFKMEEEYVSLALEASLGGFCGSLKVSQIADRVFSFCVSNKKVGFHITKMRSYSCPQFKCYFHLWGKGGPNWQWEFDRWKSELQEEWVLISPSKKALQLGMQALKAKAPKSSIYKAKAKKNLVFAESISYTACKGYQPPPLEQMMLWCYRRLFRCFSQSLTHVLLLEQQFLLMVYRIHHLLMTKLDPVRQMCMCWMNSLSYLPHLRTRVYQSLIK
jgi:hypothetical protein